MQSITFISCDGDTFIFRGLCERTIDDFKLQTALFANDPEIDLTWQDAAFLNWTVSKDKEKHCAKHKTHNRIE